MNHVIFGPVSAVRMKAGGNIVADCIPGGEGIYAWQGAALAAGRARLAAGIGRDFDNCFGAWAEKNDFNREGLVLRTDYGNYCEAQCFDRELNSARSVYGPAAGPFYYAESILFPQQFLYFLHDAASVILCERPELVSLRALNGFRAGVPMAICWIVPERMKYGSREDFARRVNLLDFYAVNTDTAGIVFGTKDEEKLREILKELGKPFYLMGRKQAWLVRADSCTAMEWRQTETAVQFLGCEYTAAAAAAVLYAEGADDDTCCRAGQQACFLQGRQYGLIADLAAARRQMNKWKQEGTAREAGVGEKISVPVNAGTGEKGTKQMNKEECLTGLVRQSRISHAISREIFGHFDEKTLRVIPSTEIHRTQKIILTGCGDSYSAAVYAKSLFERITKIETHAVRCIDLARHIDPKEMGYAPVTPLVIAISVSGNVTRVAEALRTAGKYGANTLAITDHADSPVGRAARHVLAVGLPSWGEYRPGSNNYTGILIALTCLALRFGRAVNTLCADEYGDMRRAIGDYMEAFEKERPALEERLFRLSESWAELDSYDFIGDGADYATAFMNAAKFHETFGGYTGCCGSGDWEDTLACKKNPQKIGRVVIANRQTPSFDCLKRTVGKALGKGSPCLVISDGEEEAFDPRAEVLAVPRPRYGFLLPLLQHYPVDMLAGFIAARKGYAEILRLTAPEFSNPLAVDTNRIRNSQIVLL